MKYAVPRGRGAEGRNGGLEPARTSGANRRVARGASNTTLDQRLAPRFERSEVWARAGRYVAGPQAGGAQERLADGRAPRGAHARRGAAPLECGALGRRGDAQRPQRGYVVEHFGDPRAILIMDESGFL